MIPIILSIAGSDPSGGAGIQADSKTISALGGYAATVITAITAQNTQGVQAVYPLSNEEISAQLTSVLSDIHPHAIKIGMMPHIHCIQAIVKALKLYPKSWTVCDPVMISTSGRRLMDLDAVQCLEEELFPLCSLITPNLHEASFLSNTSLTKVEDMKQWTKLLSQQYGTSVLIKGGHLPGDVMCDVLYDINTHNCHQFTSKRIDSPNLHGTGCTLSSAIATNLALNHPLPDAIRLAKDYMNQAIQQGKNLQIGKGNGPLWHFFE